MEHKASDQEVFDDFSGDFDNQDNVANERSFSRRIGRLLALSWLLDKFDKTRSAERQRQQQLKIGKLMQPDAEEGEEKYWGFMLAQSANDAFADNDNKPEGLDYRVA